MKRQTWRLLSVIFLMVVTGSNACKRAPQPSPSPPPSLTLKLKAVTPDGEPLAGVAVTALGKPQGETGATGEIVVQFTAEPGEEVPLTATLDKPGLKFAPWAERFVVRKWDESKPETMTYSLEAKLSPVELKAPILIQGVSGPLAGATVRIDGKPLGKTDASGQVSVDLRRKLTRSAKVAVAHEGYEPWERASELKAGESFLVTLVKIGVVYGKLLVGYEVMGQLVPVPDAEIKLGGNAAGRTDAGGSLKYQAPPKASPVQVRKEGFLPDPAEGEVPGKRAAQSLIPLFPREAPIFRILLAPPKLEAIGDKELESLLPEIGERFSDYVFSHGCFEKTEDQKLAQAVIRLSVARAEGVLVSARVERTSGKQIGAFAETGKVSRVRQICETLASRVLDVFPFEGHVLGQEEGRVLTSLGSARDRGVRKGDNVAFFRWDGAAKPTLAPLGKGVIRRVDNSSSRVELAAGAPATATGDKVILLPRAVEATFDAALDLTVKAGREGTERPLADVSVYRNGVWVGTTSSTGEIRVPVSQGDKFTFLFAKGGLKAHTEEIQVSQSQESRAILLPAAITRLRLESEPSNARVVIDDEEMGVTPLERDVLMGFHRVKIDAGGDWRMYDAVLEFTNAEEDYTGGRRIALQKDVLKQATALLAKNDVDGAIAILSKVQLAHPDYSSAHHRLAGLYLDEKKNAPLAVQEYENVLALPANRELVNKRFAVTFYNLGRAYYQLGTAEGYTKAIERLTTARDNKRFFPKAEHDQTVHDTLYFLALSSHKLYHLRGTEQLLRETSARWKEYFDFFPASLAKDEHIRQARVGAEQYYEEIRRKLKEQE